MYGKIKKCPYVRDTKECAFKLKKFNNGFVQRSDEG
jgi:hypothetical protein